MNFKINLIIAIMIIYVSVILSGCSSVDSTEPNPTAPPAQSSENPSNADSEQTNSNIENATPDTNEDNSYGENDVDEIVAENDPEPCLIINTEKEPPLYLKGVGDLLFFFISPIRTVTELWKTDGSPSGTAKVKSFDISIEKTAPSDFLEIAGIFYFIIDDGVHGRELWKSDGTGTGTLLVKDIRPGKDGSDPKCLVRLGDTLFFSANNDTHGQELWKSNGTELGTFLVKDIKPGGEGSYPTGLIEFKNNVYFAVNFRSDESIIGLWKSDGTEQGTIIVEKGTYDNFSAIYSFYKTSDSLFFESVIWPLVCTVPQTRCWYYLDDYYRADLYISDGINTSRELSFVPEFDGVRQSAGFMTVIGDYIYYTAFEDTAISNHEEYGPISWKNIYLYKYNLLTGYSTFIKDLLPNDFVKTRDQLFLGFYDENLCELWKTDGSSLEFIKSFNYESEQVKITNLTVLNEEIFFSVSDLIYNTKELWRSDGTGTVKIMQISEGINGSFSTLLTTVKDKLYYVADINEANNFGLWCYSPKFLD